MGRWDGTLIRSRRELRVPGNGSRASSAAAVSLSRMLSNQEHQSLKANAMRECGAPDIVMTVAATRNALVVPTACDDKTARVLVGDRGTCTWGWFHGKLLRDVRG